MLVQLAWKNIWRSRTRSLVVICAIAIGLWAGTFIMGFYNGTMLQRIEIVISNEVSHFQFHTPEFEDVDIGKIKHGLNDAASIEQRLKNDPLIAGFSSRRLVQGVVSTAHGDAGVKIVGIDPESENSLTGLSSKLVEGTYFESKTRKIPVLIGQKQAEKLKLKIKSKLILVLTDKNDEAQYLGAKVVGIFNSHNDQIDLGNIYVPSSSLASIAGCENPHEIAVLLKDQKELKSTLEKYQEEYSSLSVKSWEDISPGMRMMIDTMDTTMTIIVVIIVMALVFGIVNTMLMSVLERTREFGILMAIGMNKGKVFRLVVVETLLFAFIGGPLGLLLAYLCITYLGSVGIDLSAMSDSLESMGFATTVYPALELGKYINNFVIIFIFTVLASIYPARKVVKLKPVKAIRKT